jgi:outer membrane lipoprotein-sorting protein
MLRHLPFLLLLFGLHAHADEQGEAWLQRIDDAARVEDAHLILEVEVTDARGQTAPRTLKIWQRGDEERMVRITAPARLKGVGLLVTRDENVYLFLPSYPPARRVVGSKRTDAFLGTDFAVEDLSRLEYVDHYDAIVSGSDGDLTILTLTPRSVTGDKELRLWVDSSAVVHRIDHVNEEGSVTRRLVLDEIREIEGRPIAHHMLVTDLANGRQTEARVSHVQIDSGLPGIELSVGELENP